MQSYLAAYALIGLVLYVIVGFEVGGAPKKAYAALAYAPFYAVWKLVLRSHKRSSAGDAWIRTSREQVEVKPEATANSHDKVEANHDSAAVSK